MGRALAAASVLACCGLGVTSDEQQQQLALLFPLLLDGKQCMGLAHANAATDLASCVEACQTDASCATYQWCEDGPCR